MSNFAYEHVPEYEYVKQVFLDKGFPEEVIQYVLFRNANYHYENLEIRMTVLEKQMVELKDELKNGIEKLDTKIDSVRNELLVEIKGVRSELKGDIEKLDTKIDSVRSELKGDIEKLDGKIDKLDTKIDSVRNELKSELSSKIDSAIKPLYWIFGFVSTFAVSAVIGLFIHYLSK
ncbi:hypothetical protein DB313_04540 [Borrelia turcica IST7]|uniref:DUF1640 domain-containing protein n=1 Tax=Borrelia turcica IST7 TaxID=1104446 RepID=A0A386PM94_9SPIR|nr:Bdr family repetitive protein [Borrelia turcica]AYE36706.1 hypothetical protein DB313_04540 [Borrelia turcica IST7]